MKEPSKPIIKKNLTKFSDKFFPRSRVIRYPIKKEPIILTVIVPYSPGKKKLLLRLVKINLRIAPIAPPLATSIKLNNIIKLEAVLLHHQ